MFDWFKKLFRKKDNKPALQKSVISDEGCVSKIDEKGAIFPPVTLRHNQKATVTWEVNTDKGAVVFRDIRVHSVDDLRKYAQQQKIAKQNIERQKATLGYGLKSRNFKPRSAYEKRNWKLDKKPDED